MIDDMIQIAIEEGFCAVDFFQEKQERRIFHFTSRQSRFHEEVSNRLAGRAFWEKGEPLAFSLSAPTLKEFKQTLTHLKRSQRPEGKTNYSGSLPRHEESFARPHIWDHSISQIGEKEIAELHEKIREAVISFPGLKLDELTVSLLNRRIQVGNSFGFGGKYRKSVVGFQMGILFHGHRLEIGESRIAFSHLNPERLLSRAFNMLDAVVRHREIQRPVTSLVFSPEAMAALLREFSDGWKGGGCMVRKQTILGAPAVTLADDATLDDLAGSVPFDDEGVAGRETVILNKGLFQSPIADIKNGFLSDKGSTGNGFREEKGISPQPNFSTLYIKPSPFPLSQMLNEAGKGIVVLLAKPKSWGGKTGNVIFSAYGFLFQGDEIGDPVHFYFQTSFRSFLMHVTQVSRELRFFYPRFGIGSPYVWVEGKMNKDHIFCF